MTEDVNQQLIEALDRRVERRNDRRDFFKSAFGAAAVAGLAGGAAIGLAGRAEAQSAPSDADVLNFALNLEYLEAQFYSFAANGTGLAANMLTGLGTQGAVTGGRKVTFSDPIVAAYAKEIAGDELAHVTFLRTQLGTSAIAQPAIDIDVTPTSAFSNAARAAGLIGAGEAFNVYENDNNFLLGAYIFEDVGVTAYKGGATLLTNKTYLEAAAGILAVEAYHAALVRTVLYRKGVDTPALRTSADKISNARDSLDGTTDLDQGISTVQINGGDASNIVPLDENGLAFSRTVAQVHNIAYLTNARVMAGGFFPNGTNNPNADLRFSGAN
ncbi:ferritin-like domain-containing protein [Sphingomonas echinoides]|uniref:ferritin-like domain-containing protein n=1 Tax=Sphingomonas echinoides TaxID=59803 RepID=UPI0024137F8D|nr:ferritin-like domain-containing protein [Sphingomonas echinoides]